MDPNKQSNTDRVFVSDRLNGPVGRYTQLWNRPGYLIRRLHQIHVGLFAEACGADGVTAVQFAILSVLLKSDGIDQLTLSKAVGIDRTSGADVIKRLVRNELVTREPSKNDARAKAVRITTAGRRLIGEMQPAMEAAQDKLMDPLNAEDQAEFMQLLSRLINANNESSRAPMA
ncbi:MarR family transcriptional regulator [Octadecabacter arcticus 238]|jgi:DNA-binding MarR family transcriptional regulator|uniref:MarR family transcriptional regulator n=1 Tax=Octadecabacter arcticus 238 TaxID=391616 RepID=M9RML8_9RHOB|nr:MarR family winged helix-turn-helix transcriptional regulator [Octadecabacter arcticus]AGI71040.1 MarR family transcriptional regulator [Octadecabacter arcticus 238]